MRRKKGEATKRRCWQSSLFFSVCLSLACRPSQQASPAQHSKQDAELTLAPSKEEASSPQEQAASSQDKSSARSGGENTSAAGPGSQKQEAFEGELPIEGHEAALVFLPSGPGPFPVLMATHGAGGTAEHHLRYYRQLSGDRFVIVAPRGRALSAKQPEGGYYYENHLRLQEEVLAAVAAMKSAYGQRLQSSQWIYAGYSQGATMGALMVLEHGQLFDSLLLLEGGRDGWTHARAQKFVKDGGKRVLWICGSEACAKATKGAAQVAQGAGLELRLLTAPGAGHTYYGGVREQLQQAWPWFSSQK